ncbi:MAG TPA: UDP-2,3-diacylglucosamine diphosphatase LpxI [Tepidisphaeraceae bacterium]|nr:UDP-2,3-diacylglucosamine diphosphatase LpxI [Tepidisphaeraceae bacterium]
MEPLGLIAGEGVFPILVARGARRAGRTVVCAALAGHAWGELKDECDQFAWVGILRLGKWIRFLKSRGCTEAIMVGRVNEVQLYDRWRYLRYIPDWRTVVLFWKIIRRDKRSQAILQALVDELASAGITLIDSTQYTPEHMVAPGVMTRRKPTEAQWNDIRFGYELCKTVSRLDIGQSIAVVDRDVIAVEAIEGTNAMIERAGKLCRTGGWTLIKVSNARQDMRVDVPTVGTTTIEKLASAGAGCLVLEPGKTIILEKPKVLELADRLKIAVVGFGGTAGEERVKSKE